MAFSSGGGNATLSEINITPMVDVMLVLMIIFMVASPSIKKKDSDTNREVNIDLPVTKDNPNVINPDDIQELILEIDDKLKVSIGTVVITDCGDKLKGKDAKRFEACFQDVEDALKNNEKLKEDKRLYILADTEIPYGFVVGIMNRIKLAGITNVGMVTNPDYIDE